jgi:hypothetical protein
LGVTIAILLLIEEFPLFINGLWSLFNWGFAENSAIWKQFRSNSQAIDPSARCPDDSGGKIATACGKNRFPGNSATACCQNSPGTFSPPSEQ